MWLVFWANRNRGKKFVLQGQFPNLRRKVKWLNVYVCVCVCVCVCVRVK